MNDEYIYFFFLLYAYFDYFFICGYMYIQKSVTIVCTICASTVIDCQKCS